MSLKERLRGIVAAVATAALAFSVAPVTAMAAAPALEPGTATISGLGADVDNVELYQIATITNGSDNVLVTEANDAYASILGENCENFTEANKEAIAAQVEAVLTGEATYSVENGDGTIEKGTATFDDVNAGLYLVKVSPRDAGVVYQTVIMKVAPQKQSNGTWGVPAGTVGHIKVSTNNVETSLAKQVSATGVDGWTSNIDTLDAGDTAYFKVSVILPVYKGIDASSKVNFQLVDTLPAGLTLKSATASIGSKASYSTESGINVNGNVITVTVPASDLAKVAEGDQLVLLVNATVDADQAGVLTNTAHAVWYQSLSDKTTSTTEDVSASVTVYGAQVTKYVGTEGPDDTVTVEDGAETINGAVFKLQKLEGADWKDVSTEAAANPTTSVKSLGAGTYRWYEVSAPAGYQCQGAGAQFVISGRELNAGNDYTHVFKFGNLEDTFVSLLPQTGGPGTIALTVAGAGLVAGAAYLVIRSRKEN